MPNTYKSLGKAKRRQFLDSRAAAGQSQATAILRATAGAEKEINTYSRKSEDLKN